MRIVFLGDVAFLFLWFVYQGLGEAFSASRKHLHFILVAGFKLQCLQTELPKFCGVAVENKGDCPIHGSLPRSILACRGLHHECQWDPGELPVSNVLNEHHRAQEVPQRVPAMCPEGKMASGAGRPPKHHLQDSAGLAPRSALLVLIGKEVAGADCFLCLQDLLRLWVDLPAGRHFPVALTNPSGRGVVCIVVWHVQLYVVIQEHDGKFRGLIAEGLVKVIVPDHVPLPVPGAHAKHEVIELLGIPLSFDLFSDLNLSDLGQPWFKSYNVHESSLSFVIITGAMPPRPFAVVVSCIRRRSMAGPSSSRSSSARFRLIRITAASSRCSGGR